MQGVVQRQKCNRCPGQGLFVCNLIYFPQITSDSRRKSSNFPSFHAIIIFNYVYMVYFT